MVTVLRLIWFGLEPIVKFLLKLSGIILCFSATLSLQVILISLINPTFSDLGILGVLLIGISCLLTFAIISLCRTVYQAYIYIKQDNLTLNDAWTWAVVTTDYTDIEEILF